MTAPLQGRIDLKTYIAVLRMAAKQNLKGAEAFDKADARRRATRELLAAGLLSDEPTSMGSFTFRELTVLTPDGAAALVDWEDYLHKRSWRGRLEATGLQLLLVLAGAVANAMTGWLG